MPIPRIAKPANRRLQKFQITYRNDLAAFAHDCIDYGDGEGPNAYQTEILAEVAKRGRVAFYGPHGIGKTFIMSIAALHGVLCFNNTKVPTTASAWRQLSTFLWPEIHKWASRIKWDKVGREPFLYKQELMALRLRRGSTCEAYAVASSDHNKIEGAHAAHVGSKMPPGMVMYIYDEAKAIKNETFDASEGAFATEGTIARAIAGSTPGPPLGRFHDICSRKPGYGDWWVKHITIDEAIAAGRISAAWAEQRKEQWGEKSAIYRNRVLGEFAADEENTIIPLHFVEAAVERWYEWRENKQGDLVALGVDIGGEGIDPTVIAPVYATSDGKKIVEELHEHSRKDLMDVVGTIIELISGNKKIELIVDVIGLGAGVVSRLREMNYEVLAFNAAEHSDLMDITGEVQFLNTRAASWWGMRELLDPSNNNWIALPPDGVLIGQLTAPTHSMTSFGKRQVESKKDIRKRLHTSTDRADAVIMGLLGDELGDTYDTTISTFGDY